jgi:hypothetical protein
MEVNIVFSKDNNKFFLCYYKIMIKNLIIISSKISPIYKRI